MDFLECPVCNVPYDEDGHRPRNPPCRHDICSSCVRALINDSKFECPKCREKHNVDTAEDLLINFGLIDVIRAIKSGSIHLAKETGARASGATNDELCNVHGKALSHWCLKCQMWICDQCMDSHSTLAGCSTTSIARMKEYNIKDMEPIMTAYEKDVNYVSSSIQEHTDKRKELLEMAEKHAEEVKKLCIVLEKGNILKEQLVESKKDLQTANSPHNVSDGVRDLTQKKQSLCSWSVKIHGTDTQHSLSMTLQNQAVYAEMMFGDKKMFSKLSKNEEGIYIHPLQKQVVPEFGQVQKMLPASPSLIFVEMSLNGSVKGRMLVRLDRKIPNIRENLVLIVTGQRGHTLSGQSIDHRDSDCIGASSLPFSTIPVSKDSTGTYKSQRGDVVGWFISGYLERLYFQVDSGTYNNQWRVVGSVVQGLDIIQDCYDNYSDVGNVKITDCGLILEQE